MDTRYLLQIFFPIEISFTSAQVNSVLAEVFTMRAFLRQMAHCAVTSFSAGRWEPLPPHQQEPAGYVPDAIQVNVLIVAIF